jgi:hypothetical protein
MRRPVNGQWSESEVAKLRALAQKIPVHDLVKALRRSRGAITAKAFSLRLSLDVRKGRAPSPCQETNVRPYALAGRSVAHGSVSPSSRCGIVVTSF